MTRAKSLRAALGALLLFFVLGAGASGCKRASATPDAGVDAGDGGAGDGGPSDGGGEDGSDAGAPDGGDAGTPITVSQVFPADGPAAGGTNVLVTGAGFVQGFATTGGGAVSALTTVKVGGALATAINVIDDNRLQATTPAGTPGAADVEVDNPNGAGTCAGCFRFLAHVEVDSVDPPDGPSRGGTAVTVHGAGFTSDLSITFAGAPLVQLAIVDVQTATGFTPPGALGPAEVAANTSDGRGSLLGAFTYQDPLTLTDVQPRLVATAGGAQLVLTGTGFSSQATVSIDGIATNSYWSDPDHLGALAPAHAAGPVLVEVLDPGALAQPGQLVPRADLARGLVYGDPVASPPGPLALEALWPTHGPLAGGTCPTACLNLVGSGFTLPDLIVSIGAAQVPPSSLHVASDQALSLDLPAGSAPGAVAVTLSSASTSQMSSIPASDPGAFHYDPILSISSISPATGPASGSPAVAVALAGVGFDESAGAPLEVRIGALDATGVQVSADGTSLTAVAPAGPGGPADVEVIATDSDGTQRTALLPAAFTFTAPLSLLQLSPSSGSQSGGQQVTLYGTGFTPDLGVTFAAAAATNVQVLSSTEASCTLPPGSPGAVDVSATASGATATLRSGFTYYDPTSTQGGTTGAILQGTLNVTVLDEGLGGGLSGATVEVTLSDGNTLSGLTDSNGQITFSDPRLVLAASLVASKPTYNSLTVTDITVEDITVYLLGPTPTPPPPSDAGSPPPPEVATISGHVYGFKIPPTLVLNSNQRVVAYVRVTATSIYSGAPFASPGAPIVVTSDGGAFSFQTEDLSPFALYAELGVETNEGNNLTSFSPFLLGVLRGVQPDPNAAVTNADIIFDTHLDQSVSAQLVSPPDPGAGNTLLHQAAVDLDLGSAGIIPLASVQTTNDEIDFSPLPAAEGQGFVFIDECTNGSAESVYLRRVFSDVSQGVTLGPYLPFPILLAPLNQGPPFTGTFSWSIGDGLQPNLLQLRIDSTQTDGTDISWSAVLPGTALSVDLPAVVQAQLPVGSTVAWTLTASYAPGFDYDFWTYGDLDGTGWISYAYGFNQYTVTQ